MLQPSLHQQGPGQGAASGVPLLRGSGTCPSTGRAGLGGALRHGARTKLPSSCPVFWAIRTMRWCGSSERASGTRPALTEPLWVGQNAEDDDTGAPRATAEGLIFNTLLTQKEKRSKATESPTDQRSHMELFSQERMMLEKKKTFGELCGKKGNKKNILLLCFCIRNSKTVQIGSCDQI